MGRKIGRGRTAYKVDGLDGLQKRVIAHLPKGMAFTVKNRGKVPIEVRTDGMGEARTETGARVTWPIEMPNEYGVLGPGEEAEWRSHGMPVWTRQCPHAIRLEQDAYELLKHGDDGQPTGASGEALFQFVGRLLEQKWSKIDERRKGTKPDFHVMVGDTATTWEIKSLVEDPEVHLNDTHDQNWPANRLRSVLEKADSQLEAASRSGQETFAGLVSFRRYDCKAVNDDAIAAALYGEPMAKSWATDDPNTKPPAATDAKQQIGFGPWSVLSTRPAKGREAITIGRDERRSTGYRNISGVVVLEIREQKDTRLNRGSEPSNRWNMTTTARMIVYENTKALVQLTEQTAGRMKAGVKRFVRCEPHDVTIVDRAAIESWEEFLNAGFREGTAISRLVDFVGEAKEQLENDLKKAESNESHTAKNSDEELFVISQGKTSLHEDLEEPDGIPEDETEYSANGGGQAIDGPTGRVVVSLLRGLMRTPKQREKDAGIDRKAEQRACRFSRDRVRAEGPRQRSVNGTTKHEDRCNGKPVVEKTRIQVQAVLGWLASGDTPETAARRHWIATRKVRNCLEYGIAAVEEWESMQRKQHDGEEPEQGQDANERSKPC